MKFKIIIVILFLSNLILNADDLGSLSLLHHPVIPYPNITFQLGVRSLTEKTYYYRNGNWIPVENDSKYTFSEDGFLESYSLLGYLNGDIIEVQKTIYEYSNGIISKIYKYQLGELVREINYEIIPNGNRKYILRNDHRNNRDYVHFFSENGYCEKIDYLGPRGVQDYYEYNSEGKLLKKGDISGTVELYQDGRIISSDSDKSKLRYIYSNGELSELLEMDENGESSIKWIYSYNFDDKGNWILKTVNDFDINGDEKPQSKVVREFEYF